MLLRPSIEKIAAHTKIAALIAEFGNEYEGSESVLAKIHDAVVLRISELSKRKHYTLDKADAKYLAQGRINKGRFAMKPILVEATECWLTTCSSTTIYRINVGPTKIANGVYALVGNVLCGAYSYTKRVHEPITRIPDWRSVILSDDFMTAAPLPKDLGPHPFVHLSLNEDHIEVDPRFSVPPVVIPKVVVDDIGYSLATYLHVESVKSIAIKRLPITIHLPYEYPTRPVKLVCGDRVMYQMPMISSHIAKREVAIDHPWLTSRESGRRAQQAAAAIVYHVEPMADDDWIAENIEGKDPDWLTWVRLELSDHRGTINHDRRKAELRKPMLDIAA